MSTSSNRVNASPDVFWGELAPPEHLVQMYENDDVFLDTLEGFVAGGLKSGDGVVVIATPQHARGLDARLEVRGIDAQAAIDANRFIVLDAEETLAKFMHGGWPNDQDFDEVIKEILARAGANDRRVRAFGEMVAILWGRGNGAATVRLEYLWHNLCNQENFTLFCAYPKIGFTEFTMDSMQDICNAHSRVIH